MSTTNGGLFQYGGVPVPFSFTGNHWFVKPSTGSDGNSGKTIGRPFKTLAKALASATANNNDVVYLISESNTASATTDYQSATLDWNKDLVHLIGVGAPSMVSQRARIAQLSTATGLTSLMTVSADGCVIKNISIFHGVDDATSLIACKVTGTRNYFENVHFAGIGHATMSAAGCASLSLDGGAENVFKNCVIGVDTVDTDADGVNLLCDTAATRNMFDDCLFQLYITAAGACHVKIADATAIDRWLWFRNCQFMSESTNKAVDMTEVFNVPAGIAQGKIVLQNCSAMDDGGAPVWTAGIEGIIWADMVAPAASAAGGLMTNL